jgi:hypothetical protein
MNIRQKAYQGVSLATGEAAKLSAQAYFRAKDRMSRANDRHSAMGVAECLAVAPLTLVALAANAAANKVKRVMESKGSE